MYALAKQEWAKGLDDLTNEEIARGLDKCRRTLEWPPSIAEFRNFAKPKTYAYHQDCKLIDLNKEYVRSEENTEKFNEVLRILRSKIINKDKF